MTGFTGYAQEVQRKNVTALRIDEAVRIDGRLDEPAYQQAEIVSDFLQITPYNGRASFKLTEVRVLYDDNALYISAMMYDNPDSIANYITTRDNNTVRTISTSVSETGETAGTSASPNNTGGGSDYFRVFLDPNNEGMLAYIFEVTPANGQTDIKVTSQGSADIEDPTWDAVWQSTTQILEDGWSAELRIPYSAIRFSAAEEKAWGINFYRYIPRYNSNNSWSLVNTEIQGVLIQTGQLHGLKDIEPPVRLSVTPYVAEYMDYKTGDGRPDYTFKGGLDLKYGISESHTLDMMLIPDFGQIQSDDEQLNLTVYETFYTEKRQFFNEGSELFGRGNIFYSRRIGAAPIFNDSINLSDNEVTTYRPGSTQIVNATKISGRSKNGWGIGFLNAMTLPAEAEVRDTLEGEKREIVTQPFTNYNVSVVEKTLKNNSFISLINSNLSVADNPYSANVTATQFLFKNRRQTYQLSGSVKMSYKPESENKTGYGYDLAITKITRKFRFSGSRTVYSNTLDINDLGYLYRNNVIEHDAEVSYNIYDPFSIFKTWSVTGTWANARLFKPNASIRNSLSSSTEFTFINNWRLGISLGYNFTSYDYFEPRTPDNSRFAIVPGSYNTGLNFNTDLSKKLSLYYNQSVYNTPEKGRWGALWNSNLNWRASARFNIFYQVSYNLIERSKKFAYVDHSADAILFETYSRRTITNVISTEYAFSTKLSLSFRARHYWSVADYEDKQYLLTLDGSFTEYSNNLTQNDINSNIFNIDMIFKWEFAPGSELSIAWKKYINTFNSDVDINFSDNLSNTWNANQINNLSLKVLYYIDYNSFFKMK